MFVSCSVHVSISGMQAGREPGRRNEGWRVGGKEQGEDGRDRGIEGMEGGRKR